MRLRALPLLLLACIAVSGCALKQAKEREAMLRHLYAQQGVAEKPYALDAEIKHQCHTRIQRDIIAAYRYPDSWTPFKELAPMEKATHQYALRTQYRLPDGDNAEKPHSTEHTIFYMAEYLGEDFVGSGTSRRYVCTVRKDEDGLHLDAVASDEGFKRAMNLPIVPPSAW